MLRKGSDSDTTSPQQTKENQEGPSRRAESKDEEHEMLENLEADEESLRFDLHHDLQRQLQQEDYIDEKTLTESQDQRQVESYDRPIVKKNALGVGTYKDAQNKMGGEGNDVVQNNESSNSSGNSSSQTNQTLEENSQAAVLRHEDPLPERDVVGDSIFPFQQVQQQQEPTGNVFGTRQHGNGWRLTMLS